MKYLFVICFRVPLSTVSVWWRTCGRAVGSGPTSRVAALGSPCFSLAVSGEASACPGSPFSIRLPCAVPIIFTVWLCGTASCPLSQRWFLPYWNVVTVFVIPSKCFGIFSLVTHQYLNLLKVFFTYVLYLLVQAFHPLSSPSTETWGMWTSA